MKASCLWAELPEPVLGSTRRYRVHQCPHCWTRAATWVPAREVFSPPEGRIIRAWREGLDFPHPETTMRTWGLPYTPGDEMTRSAYPWPFQQAREDIDRFAGGVVLGGWPAWFQGDRTPRCCGAPLHLLAQVEAGSGDPDTTYGLVFHCTTCDRLHAV